MTGQEEILTELRNIVANNQHYTTWTVSTPHLVALVNKFVQDEREECAKVADEYKEGLERNYSEIIADAIRARGTT